MADLRVRAGAHVAIEEGVRAIEEGPEVLGVGEVAIVDEVDAQRGVHKEGLCFLGGGGSRSGVSYMANARAPCHHKQRFVSMNVPGI